MVPTLSMAANNMITTGEFIGVARAGGSNGFSTFSQSGGTNTSAEVAEAEALYLGYYVGASGIYLVSGSGALKTHSIYGGYNGRGSFSQRGGTVMIPMIGYGTVELGLWQDLRQPLGSPKCVMKAKKFSPRNTSRQFYNIESPVALEFDNC
jgi:hypothetical protein